MKALHLASAILAARSAFAALQLDVNSEASVKSAASAIAKDMVSYYQHDNGAIISNIPGLLQYPPYFWWTAGGMMGSLIDYWHYTGDDTYNDIVYKGILHQASPTADFMPANQTKDEGNDDQAFWAFTALAAAETGFKNPPPDQPQWLALAQAVFNLQASRWDYASCDGGLHWQLNSFGTGYYYKSAITQGGLFAISARLGAYTGNTTYFEWADRVWDWMDHVHLIGPQYQVLDGTDSQNNCSGQVATQWTYNFGVFLHGAAVMWNQTANDATAHQLWRTRVEGLIKQAEGLFFTAGADNKTVVEVACERNDGSPGHAYCDNDQVSFKGYMFRWMGQTMKLCPWTVDIFMPLIKSNAMAAMTACTPDGKCGNKWWTGTDDGLRGVGEQISALEVVQANLVQYVLGPLSNGTGGTSVGDPSAGTGHGHSTISRPFSEISTGERAGAGILTAILVIGMLGGSWYAISE